MVGLRISLGAQKLEFSVPFVLNHAVWKRHLRQKLSDWHETEQSANLSNETKQSFISVSISVYMIASITEIWLFGDELETETETKLNYQRIAAKTI